MDHGAHGMIMYFHEGGMIHGFLFKDWMLHNSNDHMKAGFFLFFAAFFYEGLKVKKSKSIFELFFDLFSTYFDQFSNHF